jgi:hypothetical protein
MIGEVIRSGWDVEGGYTYDTHQADGHCHCLHYTPSGGCCPGYQDWEGMQRAWEWGERIGLLPLDLDQGTMTVYKNDERLGVMATGLSGEYCWALPLRGRAAACTSRPLKRQPRPQRQSWRRR